jgi:hypothetical protein
MRFTGGVSTTYFPTPRQGAAAEAAETNPEGIAEALPDDTAALTTAPAPVAGTTATAATPPVQPRPKPAKP